MARRRGQAQTDQGVIPFPGNIPLVATGTVAPVSYALFMKTNDMVGITLVCFGCSAERSMRIPRERGITPGKYLRECFACQERRYGIAGGSVPEPSYSRE